MLPETTREMKSSGFWIGMHPDPDKIILSNQDIIKLNLKIEEEINSAKNILSYDENYEGKKLKEQIEGFYNYILNSKNYLSNGKMPSKKFFQEIKDNIYIDNIPENINVEYGLILKFSNQRVIPSSELLNDIPRELFFDSLQMSALDIATPVVVLHKSKDKKWSFVHSPRTDGWIKSDNIIICKKEELISFLTKKILQL